MTGRSYRPGDWFGIFGELATVVLPPSEKARVAGVWAMVDDGAGFDEVLDALIADGLRELPGFVLVSDREGETKVVIRGAAKAEFTTDEGTVTVEGSSATTWAERSLKDVRSMRIDVAESEGAEDLAIHSGLVRIARTDRPAYVAEPAVEPEPGVHQEHDVPVVGAHDLSPDVNVMDAAALSPALEPRPGSVTEEAGWAQPSEPLQPAAPDVTSAWGPPPPPPAPAWPEANPADAHTQAGNWTLGDPLGGQRGASPQPPAPTVVAAPVARLTFSSGEVVEVDRSVLVGRAPEARRFASGEQPQLVNVPSPHQEISSTHLEIRPGAGADQGSAVVTDLGSTNGTVLVQPGLPPEDLKPGIAVQLIPGAIIDLGDGVTIQVGRP
jgi:hypothetical protein